MYDFTTEDRYLIEQGDQLKKKKRLVVVYLQQNKKKAKTEGKKCHTKTMWSQEKPIYLTWKTPHMSRVGKSPRRKNEGRN